MPVVLAKSTEGTEGLSVVSPDPSGAMAATAAEALADVAPVPSRLAADGAGGEVWQAGCILLFPDPTGVDGSHGGIVRASCPGDQLGSCRGSSRSQTLDQAPDTGRNKVDRLRVKHE